MPDEQPKKPSRKRAATARGSSGSASAKNGTTAPKPRKGAGSTRGTQALAMANAATDESAKPAADTRRGTPHPAVMTGALGDAAAMHGPDLSSREAVLEFSERFMANFGADGEMQVVTFVLGDEEFAFPIAQVQEIIRLSSLDLVEIPNAPRFCNGVVNLRGRIVPVVDMALRFSMSAVKEDRLNRMMILTVGDLTFGVVVDSVVEVAKVPREGIEPLPDLAVGVDSAYIVGIARIRGRVVVILDLELMFSSDEHSTINAFGESVAGGQAS